MSTVSVFSRLLKVEVALNEEVVARPELVPFI